jgi:ribonuclease Y
MEKMSLVIMGYILLGILVGYILRFIYAKFQASSVEARAKRIIDSAEREAEAKKKEGLLEIKDEMHRARIKFEEETRSRRQELENLEKRLAQKDENLDRKLDILERKEREIEKKERYILGKEKYLEEEAKRLAQVKEEQKRVLERLARMTPEEAKKVLLASMEEEAKREGATIIRRMEQEAIESGTRRAKEILSQAIQRCAVEHTADITVSTVSLPDDEMKGRVIGREGRNIRAFENATGVDLIIDDTPEAITLSAFDGVRREIARVALERLIADGRIHPARIEEVVEKVKKEMENHLKSVGEQAAFDIGVQGLHPEIIRLIGRLKYRSSYGQNVLQHSLEVAYIASVLASEVGVDAKFARRAGLIHDIGKSIDRDVEGTHAQIGADLARKYNESPKMVNAIAAHHEDCPAQSIEAILLQAADAVSAARPGSRRESLEYYLKRLENLEKVAHSFRGVEKAYAIQAGREIRIIVEPEEVEDSMVQNLAREIAKKIEKELEYPGQIKVTVIRETRAVETAK